jgi:hypothetical protein
MRWPNGGPPKLWVVIENVEHRDPKKPDTTVHVFERHDARKAWLMKHYPTYSSRDVTLLEYVQKAEIAKCEARAFELGKRR